MSKYKTGDRFIIEIKELSGSESIYMIEGLNAVVLEHDLDKLTQALSYENCPECFLKKAAYDKGAEEAWEIARKIECEEKDGGLSGAELKEIFGTANNTGILKKLTHQEAKAKIEAWEKAKEEIQVGDVVYGEDEPDSPGIAVRADKADVGYIYVLWGDGSCGKTRIDDPGLKIKKTGRHIDIQSIINQIGGE